jgi:hypothetical protein
MTITFGCFNKHFSRKSIEEGRSYRTIKEMSEKLIVRVNCNKPSLPNIEHEILSYVKNCRSGNEKAAPIASDKICLRAVSIVRHSIVPYFFS